MERKHSIQDATFPGLPLALDPARIRDLLRESLPECCDGLAVEDVRILQVQYLPQKRCSILYSVKFRKLGGRSQNQMLAAELLAHGQSPPPLDADLVRRYQQSGERPLRMPVVILPAAGLVAYAFPFDPRMPSLVAANDALQMKEKLGRMWKERGVRLRQVNVRPLGYTPGARAALLYETLSECRTTGIPEVRRLVGKLDVQRQAAELFARNWSVWKEAQLRFRMPPPVGYLAEPNVFMQEQVDGERLSELAGTGDFIGPVRQTARAIAVLHEMPLALRFRRASLQSVKAVRRWAKVLTAIRPEEQGRIRALRDCLTAELEHRAVVTGPIHADLHPSNLLVHEGQVILIDFDNMVLGDRLLDVGRFMSALRTSALRVTGRPDGLIDAGESFLERYLTQTGEDERRARLFEAAALMISAGTGFRLQREGWQETAGWLLDEAERILALAAVTTVGPPVRPTAADMKRRDAESEQQRSVDRRQWVEDPQYMRGLLAPHVSRIYGAELYECAIEGKGIKQKREQWRYRLTGWRGAERWKLVLDGFLWPAKSGRGQSERLEQLSEALDGDAEAPRLPRPVAFLRELGMQVVELPGGTMLTELLDQRDGEEALERFGRALASLHGTSVALDKSRPATTVVADLRVAATAVEQAIPAHYPTIVELLDRVDLIVLRDLSRLGPTLRHVSPRRVLVADGHVALVEVDDVVTSHPFLDAADFLARLATLDAIDPGRLARLADGFRRGYVGARPVDRDALAAFEVLSLVRAACSAAAKDANSEAVRQLLATATARLPAAEAEGAR